MPPPKTWTTAPPPSIGPDELDALYHATYEGAAETPPWRTALTRLRESLHAAHVVLILQPPAVVDCEESSSFDQAGRPELPRSHFLLPDPFATLPLGEVATVESIVGTRRMQSQLNSGYLMPGGIRDVLGMDVALCDGVVCRFRATRPLGAPPFAPDDEALCRTLMPHLLRSIRLRTRLDPPDHEMHLSAGTLRLMRIGVIVLSGNNAVLGTNQEAARILAEEDGLRCSGGNLRVNLPREAGDLRSMIERVVEPGRQGSGTAVLDGLAITRSARGAQLSVLARAVRGPHDVAEEKRPIVRLYLRAPDSGGALSSSEVLQRLFDFTQVEATIASLLAEGTTLDEVSAQLGVGRGAADVHLRSILWKTRVARQTGLSRVFQARMATFD